MFCTISNNSANNLVQATDKIVKVWRRLVANILLQGLQRILEATDNIVKVCIGLVAAELRTANTLVWPIPNTQVMTPLAPSQTRMTTSKEQGTAKILKTDWLKSEEYDFNNINTLDRV